MQRQHVPRPGQLVKHKWIVHLGRLRHVHVVRQGVARKPSVQSRIDASHDGAQDRGNRVSLDPAPLGETHVKRLRHQDGHEDQRGVIDVIVNQDGQGIAHRQLRGQDGVEASNRAHECGEEVHGPMPPETVQRHQPNVDAAKMQGQAAMHSPFKARRSQHVHLVSQLKGNQDPTDLLEGPILAIQIQGSEPPQERPTGRKTR